MSQENLRRTAINALKGVQKKSQRALLYAQALEVEGIEELLGEISVLAEQAIELVEESHGGEEE